LGKGSIILMPRISLDLIFGTIGTLLIAGFVLGLAQSISAGAAGFWGGLPFWVICIACLVLVFYEFWDSCLRNKSSN